MERFWTLNYCSIRLVEYSPQPDEETPEDDNTLQAALSAQIRKTNFQHQGAVANDRTGPTKSQESRCPKAESQDLSKLTQAIFVMKAEMGIMRSLAEQ